MKVPFFIEEYQNWVAAINYVFWPNLKCYQCGAEAKNYNELKMLQHIGLCEDCYEREASYEESQQDDYEEALNRDRYEKHRE